MYLVCDRTVVTSSVWFMLSVAKISLMSSCCNCLVLLGFCGHGDRHRAVLFMTWPIIRTRVDRIRRLCFHKTFMHFFYGSCRQWVTSPVKSFLFFFHFCFIYLFVMKIAHKVQHKYNNKKYCCILFWFGQSECWCVLKMMIFLLKPQFSHIWQWCSQQ